MAEKEPQMQRRLALTCLTHERVALIAPARFSG